MMQPQKERSNKSINPTAGYGLSRFRKQSVAAAGYLQRWASEITRHKLIEVL